MANEFPEATARPFSEDSMSLRDAIEYIRNDEAYAAAVAHVDNYDALRAAAVAVAIPYEALLMDNESRKWIAPAIWTAIEEAVTQLRAALHPQPEQEGKP